MHLTSPFSHPEWNWTGDDCLPHLSMLHNMLLSLYFVRQYKILVIFETDDTLKYIIQFFNQSFTLDWLNQAFQWFMHGYNYCKEIWERERQIMNRWTREQEKPSLEWWDQSFKFKKKNKYRTQALLSDTLSLLYTCNYVSSRLTIWMVFWVGYRGSDH